jgi:hypothetical protein
MIHRSHIEADHRRLPPKPYHCGTCTKIKGYKLKRCLARHLHESKAHLNEAYICCEQRIKRKYDFKRHLKRHIMGEYGPVTTPPRCACGYLVDEQAAVDSLTAGAEQASRAVEEYIEEHAVEDGAAHAG